MTRTKPNVFSKDQLREIYGNSPGGVVKVPEIGKMNQAEYDQLIKAGRTPEFAKAQAEKATRLKGV